MYGFFIIVVMSFVLLSISLKNQTDTMVWLIYLFTFLVFIIWTICINTGIKILNLKICCHLILAKIFLLRASKDYLILRIRNVWCDYISLYFFRWEWMMRINVCAHFHYTWGKPKLLTTTTTKQQHKNIFYHPLLIQHFLTWWCAGQRTGGDNEIGMTCWQVQQGSWCGGIYPSDDAYAKYTCHD